MVKVLIDAHLIGIGGIQTFLTEISRNINSNEFELYLLTPKSNNNIYLDRFVAKKIYTYDFASGIKGMRIYIKALKNALKDQKFDVVHGNRDSVNFVSMYYAKKYKVPVRIAHAHNSDGVKNASGLKNILIKIARKVTHTLTCKYANEFIGCSQLANEYYFGNTPAHVVYNGMDLNRFNASGRTESDKLRMITVARMSHQKNPEFTINILHEISKIRDDFEFLWIGSGNDTVINDMVKKYGLEDHYRNIPRTSEPEKYLKQSDIFLLPSFFEGFGIVAIEAQACGVDCFMSDVIPAETDLGKAFRLPLSIGEKEWAKKICDYFDSKDKLTIDENKLNKFDVKTTLITLEKAYRGELINVK